MIVFDTETGGLGLRMGCKPFLVAICDEREKMVYYEWDVDPHTREPIIPEGDKQELRDRFENQDCVVGFNTKYDILALEVIGVDIPSLTSWDNIHDVWCMSHAYQSIGKHGLKPLALRHLSIPDEDERKLGEITKAARRYGRKHKWDIARPHHPHFPWVKKSSGGKKKNRDDESALWKADMFLPRCVGRVEGYEEDHEWMNVCKTYCFGDVIRTIRLYKFFKQKLEEENLWDQYEMNRRLLKVTYGMEGYGATLRPKAMQTERLRYKKAICRHTQAAIKASARPDLNLNSYKQISKLLYEDWKLPILKLSKSGKGPSTSADDLVNLIPHCTLSSQRDFLVNHFMVKKYMTAERYRTNYEQFQQDGKVHASFLICGTQITRMSSADPNFTNVSKGGLKKDHWPDEIKKAMKKANLGLRVLFGPDSTREWYAIDFQQMHPRIFTWLCGDEDGKKVFRAGKDFYIYIASRMFRRPEEEITSDERKLSKTANLADLYGSGEGKLTSTTGISGLKDMMASAFPTRAEFILQLHEQAKGQGGVVYTTGGYKLYCNSEHKIVNYRIAGTEGEIVKRSMYDIDLYLDQIRTTDYDPRIIAMIHDELLFSFPRNHPDNYHHVHHVCSLMEDAALRHKVEIPAEATLIRNSWADGVKLSREELEAAA